MPRRSGAREEGGGCGGGGGGVEQVMRLVHQYVMTSSQHYKKLFLTRTDLGGGPGTCPRGQTEVRSRHVTTAGRSATTASARGGNQCLCQGSNRGRGWVGWGGGGGGGCEMWETDSGHVPEPETCHTLQKVYGVSSHVVPPPFLPPSTASC